MRLSKSIQSVSSSVLRKLVTHQVPIFKKVPTKNETGSIDKRITQLGREILWTLTLFPIVWKPRKLLFSRNINAILPPRIFKVSPSLIFLLCRSPIVSHWVRKNGDPQGVWPDWWRPVSLLYGGDLAVHDFFDNLDELVNQACKTLYYLQVFVSLVEKDIPFFCNFATNMKKGKVVHVCYNCWNVVKSLEGECQSIFKVLDWFHIGMKFQNISLPKYLAKKLEFFWKRKIFVQPTPAGRQLRVAGADNVDVH